MMKGKWKWKWKEVPVVFTGGKVYFYTARIGNGNVHVVWDRMLQRWAVQTPNRTIAYYDTVESAKQFVESQDPERWDGL